MTFVFSAEPDPARNNWQVICRSGDDRFVMARGFPKEAAATAWASRLNALAERHCNRIPHPTVREQAEEGKRAGSGAR
jgi:hypothetical protein